MDINAWELPFRSPRVNTIPFEHTVIALADPVDLTVCLNSEAQQGEFWEKDGSVELRCEAILTHETVHVLLQSLGETLADHRLNGNTHQPIDRWENDYAISRPVGMVYPGHRGFWRNEW